MVASLDNTLPLILLCAFVTARVADALKFRGVLHDTHVGIDGFSRGQKLLDVFVCEKHFVLYLLMRVADGLLLLVGSCCSLKNGVALVC